jgi:hypothetical protein
MHLPGRLSASTLADLLGSLHRERITGTIELSEIGGPIGRGVAGRIHRVHLRSGLVAEVETPLPAEGLRGRMDALFSIEDATISFRTARPLPRPAAPLGPAEFLHGRPRARPRQEQPRSTAEPSPIVDDDPRARALKMLGIPKGAGLGEVRRAFRRMAGALHPDRLGAAALEERQRQAARFAELSAAYHLLVA